MITFYIHLELYDSIYMKHSEYRQTQRQKQTGGCQWLGNGESNCLKGMESFLWGGENVLQLIQKWWFHMINLLSTTELFTLND